MDDMKTSKLAIASFICAILALLSFIYWFIFDNIFGPTGASLEHATLAYIFVILTLIFSIVSLVQISKNYFLKGKGIAIAGLIIGIIIFILCVFVFVKVVTYKPLLGPIPFPIGPTPANPLTISNEIKLKQLGTFKQAVGYYNRNNYTAEDAALSITTCLNVDDGKEVNKDLMFEVKSTKGDVDPSEAMGYKIVIKEKGLPIGIYLCDIAVKQLDTENIYEKKQIFIEVTE